MERRLFLTSMLALSACGVQPAKESTVNDNTSGAAASAMAERVAKDVVRLSWSGLNGAVRIFCGQVSDAPLNALQELASEAQGNVWAGVVSAKPRPYFVLEDKNNRIVRVAERLLPLEGGRNFRDLGGYVGADGKSVRWGRIYRSGVMTHLTVDDLSYLASLDIMAVCDLRSADERRSEPAPFPTEGAMMVTAFDYDMAETMASIGALMRAKTRAEAVAAFSAGYVEMANFLAPHFTDMFAKLLAGQTPLAMNCSAGKDRTGMAAAMILSVLGVERESVIEDYALSETYVPPDKYIDEMRNAGSSSSGSMTPQMAQVFAQMPDPVLRVLMGTDADVMRLTLAELDSKAGGPIAFAKAKYGLTDASISQLRSMYLA